LIKKTMILIPDTRPSDLAPDAGGLSCA